MRADAEARPLGALDEYEVADGDPDIRGWAVTTADGAALGRVIELIADVRGMRVAAVEIDFDAVGRRQVPIEEVRIDADQHAVIANASAVPDAVRTTQASEPAAQRADTVRVSRMEEEFAVARRLVERGVIGIRKRVETEHVTLPVTTTREEIIVERRPAAPGRSTEIEITDDEIRIPIIEQEVVVETRPVLEEEVVVKTKAVTEQHTVEADLRRERVDIERTDTHDRGRTKDGA